MNAKGFSDKRWKTAEKKAVGESGKSRNEGEVVWVLDVESEDLSDEKDECGDGETPKARGVKDFGKEVGADTCGISLAT